MPEIGSDVFLRGWNPCPFPVIISHIDWMSLNPYSDTVQCPITGLIHLLFPHMQSRLVPHSSISIHLFTHRPLCRTLSAAFQRAQLSRAQGSFLVRYDAGSEWGHYAFLQ